VEILCALIYIIVNATTRKYPLKVQSSPYFFTPCTSKQQQFTLTSYHQYYEGQMQLSGEVQNEEFRI